MHLDLSEIVIRTGMRTGLDVDQPLVEDPDLVFAEPLRGHLDFENSGDLINIRGTVNTALAIPCGRCLTEVHAPVELDVAEHFPLAEVIDPKRKPDEDADLDSIVSTVVYLDQGRPILDLDELLRQLIITEVPIQTLCSDACAGLCPQCGANRNETPCTCEDASRNTPLASLGALLEKQGNGSD
jgi:uncharacterized protein